MKTEISNRIKELTTEESNLTNSLIAIRKQVQELQQRGNDINYRLVEVVASKKELSNLLGTAE